jgi:hypothetical protein
MAACKSAALKELINSSIVGDAEDEGVAVADLFGAGAPLGKGAAEDEGAGDSARPCALIEAQTTIPQKRISRNITSIVIR